MNKSLSRQVVSLLRNTRLAALATLRDGYPAVSMVLFAPAPDFSAFYLHISQIALHTRDIVKDARVGLLVAQPDDGSVDPQQFARLSILGDAHPMTSGDLDYRLAQDIYLARYPASHMYFTMSDFRLFRVLLRSARYISGFATAQTLTVDQLRAISQTVF
jgi:hypothetical protein